MAEYTKINYEWNIPDEIPKVWSGQWLTVNTIQPLINRDNKLLELIQQYSAESGNNVNIVSTDNSVKITSAVNISGNTTYDLSVDSYITNSAVLNYDIYVTTGMGDIKPNTTLCAGTSLTDIVKSAFSPYKNQTVSLTVEPSVYLYAYSNTANINSLNISLSAGTNDIVQLTGYNNNTENFIIDIVNVHPFNVTTLSIPMSDVLTDNTTYKIAVADSQGHTVNTTKKIEFCWPYYYGYNTTMDINLNDGTELVEKMGNKTTNCNAYDKYIWFAYDNSYTDLNKIIDGNGYNIIDSFNKQVIKHNNHKYKLYITKEPKTYNGTFTWQY